MHMTRSLVAAACAAAFFAFAGCAAPSHRAAFDPDRRIFIPEADDLVATLRVSAVHDGEHIQIRYEFPTDDPSWYHQYWVYENGAWARYGSSDAGPEPHGFYEDRISVAIDAGNIPGYDIYGGFLVTHPGVRSRTDEVEQQQAEAHPHIGERLGESDVRKFIAQSRTGGELDTRWSRVRDPAELMDMRRQGVFLDTWQWRAHRSNPVGYADNGFVLDYRLSSEGRSMYATNADADGPAFVFNEQAAGVRALSKSRLLERGYSQDDPYFLTEATARPIRDNDQWSEGDAIPYRILREPSGSRGAIRAHGRWEDGAWRVRVTRTLEAPNRLDSHELEPGSDYTVQFAVHSGAVGARWHLVSAPVSMHIESDTRRSGPGPMLLVARAPDGTELDDAEASWIELPIFYPGQAGADEIRADPELDTAVRAVAEHPKDHTKIRRLAELLAEREPRRR